MGGNRRRAARLRGRHLCRAERWQRLLVSSGVRAARGDTYRLTCVGYMGNNLLPARAGEGFRVLLLAPRAGASRMEVLGTVVTERALDAAVLVAFFFAAAASTAHAAPALREAVLILVAGLGALAVVSLALGRRTSLGRRLHGARLGPHLARLTEATRRLRGPHAALMLWLTVVIWTAEAGVYLLAAYAVGIDIGPLQALSVMVISNLAALMPAGPGYLGTFDAAVLVSVRAMGVGRAAALGYLLVLRFLLFLPITVVGLVFFLRSYSGWSRVRRTALQANTS